MTTKDNHLVWMDLEMTGLSLETDHIIEIATLITDINLNIIAEGPEIAIHQSEEVIRSMDEWNTTVHTKSGLIGRVRKSNISLKEAELQTIEFIKKHVEAGASPLCGNSIYNDRMFIRKYMKDLNAYLHYRLIDVSTVKELYKRWKSNAPSFTKSETHRALDDIKESIAELNFYRTSFFQLH